MNNWSLPTSLMEILRPEHGNTVLKTMAETSIFRRFALLQHICDVELRCSHGILGVAYIPEAKSRKFPSWAVYNFKVQNFPSRNPGISQKWKFQSCIRDTDHQSKPSRLNQLRGRPSECDVLRPSLEIRWRLFDTNLPKNCGTSLVAGYQEWWARQATLST